MVNHDDEDDPAVFFQVVNKIVEMVPFLVGIHTRFKGFVETNFFPDGAIGVGTAEIRARHGLGDFIGHSDEPGRSRKDDRSCESG